MEDGGADGGEDKMRRDDKSAWSVRALVTSEVRTVRIHDAACNQPRWAVGSQVAGTTALIP